MSEKILKINSSINKMTNPPNDRESKLQEIVSIMEQREIQIQEKKQRKKEYDKIYYEKNKSRKKEQNRNYYQRTKNSIQK